MTCAHVGQITDPHLINIFQGRSARPGSCYRVGAARSASSSTYSLDWIRTLQVTDPAQQLITEDTGSTVVDDLDHDLYEVHGCGSRQKLR